MPSTWAPMVPPWEFNVQWNFVNFPADPEAAQPCITAHPFVGFTRSNAENETAKLNECFGRWTWRSCTDGQRVTVGGQLAIGVVFGNELVVRYGDIPPALPTTHVWNQVEVFAKYRVDDKTKLSHIFLNLSDNLGNSYPAAALCDDWIPYVSNTWRVIGTRIYNINWALWSRSNLRAVLTFLGTTNPANVGPVNVDVEWFAFRLTPESET